MLKKSILTAFAMLLGMSLPGPEALAANAIVASEFSGTLQQAVDAAGVGGMLIVDQAYTIDQPLILPRFFRLSGLGPQGLGSIAYTRDNGSAIRFLGGTTSAVTIDNLNLGGLHPSQSPGTSIGIAMAGIHHVYLNNVTIRGFDVGVVGLWSFYIHIRDSNISLNRTHNYHLIDNANSWRITGGASSQSDTAIRVETSNNTVIEQVAFESNQIGIHTSTESTHILNNRFECSPAVPMFCFGSPVGIHVDAGANLTTLVGNYYSGLDPLVDTSNDGLSFRFDHAGGPFLQPELGEEGLRVELQSPGDELVFDADGRLHVGQPVLGSNARFGVNADPGDEVMRVGIGGNTNLIVDSAGRVGIGTAAPQELLHVNGNIELSGNLITNGVLCIGSGC